MSWSFDRTLAQLETDLSNGIAAARGYRLHAGCEPCNELLDYLQVVLRSDAQDVSGKAAKDWRTVMKKRIKISHKSKIHEPLWLDDKLEQVKEVAALFDGQELHLPILASATAGEASAKSSLTRTALEKSISREPIVIKPRHGSNSKHVFMWPKPDEVDESEIIFAVDATLNAWDKSWKEESYNLQAVPKGSILLPLYSPMSAHLDQLEEGQVDRKRLSRPLELKVQVLFGQVIGACLNSHPQFLWVSRNGAVHIWDQEAPGFIKRHQKEHQSLPSKVLQTLQEALQHDWASVRNSSEHVARSVGLDELRVDWYLGDRKWGPRIGELTYMGTFALETLHVSSRLARAFAIAHFTRLGHPVQHSL